ncbi:MAG TPA: segregation/condensation protein A [Candidatus Polarisedimenticolia bacterium]|jgi:segregation and condensation protein A
MSELEASDDMSGEAAPGVLHGLSPEGATVPADGEVAPRLVLGQFEGPLDLLLHLIRTSEISIADIRIHEICRQYDGYLGLMREMNLEVAGEYLVMAATLTHIKSRMLLPAPPAIPGESIDDPRADLVRQIVEYQRIKAAAERLRDIDEMQADGFLRGNGGEDPLGPYRGERLLEVSLFDLLGAFRDLLETLGDAAPLQVQRDEISVAEKIAWILERLETAPTLSFQSLMLELPSRSERIATFLAVLELVRLRLVGAAQHRPGAEILLSRPAPEEGSSPGAGAAPPARGSGDEF